jgi:hypothetical protein
MAVSTGQSGVPPPARWQLLLRPRWLAWHAFAVVASVGMLFLGDWQLHRAESGNELSWAYTFEWPLFAAFTVFFWIKSLRDELREPGTVGDAETRPASAAAVATAEVGGTLPAVAAPEAAAAGEASPAAGVTAGATGGAGAIGTTRPTSSVPAGGHADSWDSTSWDSASWDATGAQVGADDASEPRDVARATPADGEAYLARLMAEVQRPSRRRVRH